jgi:hypothetical protein
MPNANNKIILYCFSARLKKQTFLRLFYLLTKREKRERIEKEREGIENERENR